jgi:hypothetical protein
MAGVFTALLHYMPHGPMLAFALAVALSLTPRAARREAKSPAPTFEALR